MASLTISRSSVERALGTVALYAGGLLVAAMFVVNRVDLWLPILFLSGAAVALLIWRQVPWPDTWSRYFSFGAVLLLMCAINRAFYLADHLIAGPRIDEWPFFVSAPEVAVFKGEVLTVAGILITVFSWRLAGGLQVRPSAVLDRLDTRKWLLFVVYAMSLVGMGASAARPLIAARFGQLLPTLLGLGIVCAFLLPLALFRRRWLRLGAVALLSAPFVLAASGTGMKENIILAVLPSAILAWHYLRHVVLRAGMLVIGLISIAVLTAYVESFREQVWGGRTAATERDVMHDLVDNLKSEEMSATLARGVTRFVARSNAAYGHGWAVSIADEHEFQSYLVFAPLTYVFVPRILWPEKPQNRQGWEYSGLVFGEEFISWSDSSTAAGFYTSLYLGYGWAAFAAGAGLIGLLLAGATRLALRFGGPFSAGLYNFAMLPFMLRLDETWSAGALSGPIITLAYVLLIVALAKAVDTLVPQRHRTSSHVR